MRSVGGSLSVQVQLSEVGEQALRLMSEGTTASKLAGLAGPFSSGAHHCCTGRTNIESINSRSLAVDAVSVDGFDVDGVSVDCLEVPYLTHLQ